MKTTGYLCKIDALGRIVIPKQIRNQFSLSDGISLELSTNDSEIILRKTDRNCIFCGEVELLKELKGKCICENCLKKLNS